MAAAIFEMGDSFKLRNTARSLRFIKRWKAARDEGEDKGEEARFLTSDFSELKSRGAENEKQILPKFVLGCLSLGLFAVEPQVA